MSSRLTCPKCGWSNVRPSIRTSFLDRALVLALLAPFRCRKCRLRFYRPLWSAPSEEVPQRDFPEVGLPVPDIQLLDEQPEDVAPLPEMPPRSMPVRTPVMPDPGVEPPVVAPPVEEQPPLPPPPPPEPTPRTVLVLDDDDALRKLIRRMLEREGHRVYEVGSEKEALSRLRTYRFDLVILNLDLSEPEGLALVRGIQRNHPDVKLVALCDTADAQTLNAEIPSLAVVTKPLATQALLERVRAAFRNLEVGT